MSDGQKLEAVQRLTVVLTAAARECLTTIAVVNDPWMSGALALLADMITSVAGRLAKVGREV